MSGSTASAAAGRPGDTDGDADDADVERRTSAATTAGVPSAALEAVDRARALRAVGDPTYLSVVDRAVVAARLVELETAAGDGRASSAVIPPLLGVPMAVKDNIDVAGLPTTSACPSAASTPVRSAEAVRRMEAAGAVVVAKTNLDQFATGLVGLRSPYGTPVNPLDPALVPGGSSSGSAVAVASGVVPLALGTDTAGSGRVPAAMTGTIGIKPAPGRVPTTGVVPASWSLDCVSVFTRDLGTARHAMAALDPHRPWHPVAPAAVGVADAASLDGVADGVAAGFADVADLLAERWSSVPVDLAPLLRLGTLLYGGPWLAERAAALAPQLARHGDDLDPVVAAILDEAGRWTAVEAFEAVHEREVLRSGPLAELWRRVDVVVVPTVPWLPTVAEVRAEPFETNRRLGWFTHFANLAGLAAVAVPVPAAAAPHPAVPHHVTVLGPPGREGMLLSVADALVAPAGTPIEPTPPAVASSSPRAGTAQRLWLVVAGAHLSGFPLNDQLTERDGQLVARRQTAPCYRLWRLPGEGVPRPALERTSSGGRSIEVEVWSVPTAAIGELVALIRPPLGLGTVVLDDGESHVGFVCELGGLGGATDITDWGGWRAWSAAQQRDGGHDR